MMFGLGWQEIVVIAVVAIIIFKPDNLPEMAGQAGKLLRDFRRMTQDMTGEFEKQTGVSVKDLKKNVDKEIAGLKSEMAGTTSSVQRELNSVKSTVNKKASSASKSVSSVAKKPSVGGAKTSTTAKTGSAAKPASSVTSTKSSNSKASKATTSVAPPASKNDPLADVSFLENLGDGSGNGAEMVTSKPASSASELVGAGAATTSTDASTDRADALARARIRRQSAGYHQRPSNPN